MRELDKAIIDNFLRIENQIREKEGQPPLTREEYIAILCEAAENEKAGYT